MLSSQETEMWRTRGWVRRGQLWDFPEGCGGGGGVCSLLGCDVWVSLVCVCVAGWGVMCG